MSRPVYITVERPAYYFPQQPIPLVEERGLLETIQDPFGHAQNLEDALVQEFPHYNPETNKYEPPGNWVEGTTNGLVNSQNAIQTINNVLSWISLGISAAQIIRSLPSLLSQVPSTAQAIANALRRSPVKARLPYIKHPFKTPDYWGIGDRIPPFARRGSMVLGGHIHPTLRLNPGSAVLSPNSPYNPKPINPNFPYPKPPC